MKTITISLPVLFVLLTLIAWGAAHAQAIQDFVTDDPIERERPVDQYGQLYVCDTNLCNDNNEPVQLKGMSSHGLQWYGWNSGSNSCVTPESLDALYYDWGADVFRISLYVQEGGYETDPEGFTEEVHTIINEVTDRGMYAIVDWHQLTPGDPMENLELAKEFFTDIANEHHSKNNIFYEIANEPNGRDVTWERVKEYADSIIPVIREIDQEAVILVGTPGWSSLGIAQGGGPSVIYENQIDIDDNVMYTYHFYAASHNRQSQLAWAAERMPIFVTEFGTQTYSGDGGNDFENTRAYFDVMDEHDISWTNWNYSHDWRSGAVWETGTCPNGPWTEENLKPAGQWIRNQIRNQYVTSSHPDPEMPANFALKQNYPNPFNPSTIISYPLPEEASVTLKVYDITGRFVSTLTESVQSAGYHEVTFYASELSSGIYLYKLTAAGFEQTRKMVLTK